MRRIPVAALALCSMIACQPSGELTEVQRHEVEAEVNMSLDGFWESWSQADFDRGMSYYVDSPETGHAGSEGELVVGMAAMDGAFRPVYAAIDRQDIDLEATHTVVLSLDAAVVMQRGAYSVTDTSGVTGSTMPFAYTSIWVRTEAGWKVAAAHLSQGEPAVD